MAVIATPNQSSVKVKYDYGANLDGDRVYKTKTFGSIKNTATNDDIMAVVNSISGLVKAGVTVSATNRIDNYSLTE